ncbi:MAG: hypothetical protein HUJ26_18700 [Planctomycetaceae bacterium]|nr:hypothetical protein [Planctomycetaceae bacterium]
MTNQTTDPKSTGQPISRPSEKGTTEGSQIPLRHVPKEFQKERWKKLPDIPGAAISWSGKICRIVREAYRDQPAIWEEVRTGHLGEDFATARIGDKRHIVVSLVARCWVPRFDRAHQYLVFEGENVKPLDPNRMEFTDWDGSRGRRRLEIRFNRDHE